MKKIARLFLTVCLCLCFVSVIQVSSSAEQMLSGRRWCHMSNLNNNPRCDIKLNKDYLTGSYSGHVTQASQNWNLYSGNKIYITSASFSSSNCDLSRYNLTWPYGSSVAAITLVYDKNGNVYYTGQSSSGFGTRIKSGAIYFNPAHENADAIDLRQTIVHEIGHVVNMGHVMNSNTQTVMSGVYARSSCPWSNYDRPTAYDRSVLSSMYNQLYS